jgi:hypothetical protein
MSVYQCYLKDKRYVPIKLTLVCEPETEKEAIDFLLDNGGGVYRDLLSNCDCEIHPRESYACSRK